MRDNASRSAREQHGTDMTPSRSKLVTSTAEAAAPDSNRLNSVITQRLP
jgi:hypothetical protein